MWLTVAELIPPRRDEPLIETNGRPSQRFAEYLEGLGGQTNSNTNTVTSLIDSTALALIFNLENRIGSGDFLTSDETGFTVDTDKLSVDMDEA